MNVQKITDFDLKIDKDLTLSSMGFYSRSPNYCEISYIYDCILNDMHRLSNAVGIISFGNDRLELDCFKTCDIFIYVIYTLGAEICNYVDCKLQKSYLEYVMANCIADRILFSMEYNLNESIKKYCTENDLGVDIRAEPSDNMLYIQKIIWEETLANKLADICINENFVLSPVKTNTFVLGAKRHSNCFNLEHSCSNCKSVNCNIGHENKSGR